MTIRLRSGAIASRAVPTAIARPAAGISRDGTGTRARHRCRDGRPANLAAIMNLPVYLEPVLDSSRNRSTLAAPSIVEADFVNEVGRRLLVVRDRGKRHRI